MAVAGMVALTGALTIVTACDSFGEGEGTPDGGADTSVGGEARGEVELGVPQALVLVHDQTLAFDVKVTRKLPFTKGMTLAARGLPIGLGSEAVDITPNDTLGKLKLVVGKQVPQGTLFGARGLSGARAFVEPTIISKEYAHAGFDYGRHGTGR
jgi:hypothetical protein